MDFLRNILKELHSDVVKYRRSGFLTRPHQVDANGRNVIFKGIVQNNGIE